MYFSKNSKYVLKKASWMSPSSYILRCLRSPNRKFGIKIPQEDPTKPPLRVNIPKDADSCGPDFSKHLHDTSNATSKKCMSSPRSKSVVSRSTFPVNLPIKSESATHLSELTGSALLTDKSYKKPQTQIPDGVPYLVNSDITSHENGILDSIFSSKTDESTLKCDLENSFGEKEIEEEYSTIELSAAPKTKPKIKTKMNKKVEEKLKEEDDYKKKTLYIVIDIPGKEVKNTEMSATGSKKEENDSSIEEEESDTKAPRTKAEYLFSDLTRDVSENKEKDEMHCDSAAKESLLNKARSKMGFEVHEIDDAPAYIFHLRFKKNFWNRIKSVEQVPEKEVSTRSSMVYYEENSDQEPHIFAKSFKATIREATPCASIFESMLMADKQKQINNNEGLKTFPSLLNDQGITSSSSETKTSKKKLKDFNLGQSLPIYELKTQGAHEGEGQAYQNVEISNDSPVYTFNRKIKRRHEIIDSNNNQNMVESEFQTEISQNTDFQQIQNQIERQNEADNSQYGTTGNQLTETDVHDVKQNQTYSEEERQPAEYVSPNEEMETFRPSIFDKKPRSKKVKDTNQNQNPTDYDFQNEVYQEGESQPSHELPEKTELTNKEKENEEFFRVSSDNKSGQQNEVPQMDIQTGQNVAESNKELEEYYRTYPTYGNVNVQHTDYQNTDSQSTQTVIESTKDKEVEEFYRNYPSPENKSGQHNEVPQNTDVHSGQNIAETNKDLEEFYRTYPTVGNVNIQQNDYQNTESHLNQNVIETNKELDVEEFPKTHPTAGNVTGLPNENVQNVDGHPAPELVETNKEKEYENYYKYPHSTTETKFSTKEDGAQQEGNKLDQAKKEANKEKEGEEFYRTYPTAENIEKPPEMYLTLDSIEPEPSQKVEPGKVEETVEESTTDQQQPPQPSQPTPTQTPPKVLQLLNTEEPQYAHYPYPKTDPKEIEEPPSEIPKKVPDEEKIKKQNKNIGVSKPKDKKIKRPMKVQEKEIPPIKYASKIDRIERNEPDITDYKRASNVVNMSSDKVTCQAKYCAAFPPTLSEAMRYKGKNLGFKRDCLLSHKWSSTYDFHPKDFELNPKCLAPSLDSTEFLRKSVLFPSLDKKKLHSDLIFSYRKDGLLNVLKNEKETEPKVDNSSTQNATDNKKGSSVDTLRMMQKVKEIVDFDLNNAIKIFEGRDEENKQELSSVMTLSGDRWNVNREELKKCIEVQENKNAKEIDLATAIPKNDPDQLINEQTTAREYRVPKYLPPKKEKNANIKVETSDFDYVVNYYVDKEENSIAKEEPNMGYVKLANDTFTESIKNQTEPVKNKSEPIKDLLEEKEFKAMKCEMKEGDSILVFDEESQTWKVDFSILEKRKQMKEEEELTRKSELILETIEKLENGPISRIPKPDSAEKKFFDYEKREWKVYQADKKPSKEKSKKAKTPFKESDAEEIRKKNSDMYEDLFAAKKKESEMSKTRKEAPGVSDSKKEGKPDINSSTKKEADSSKGSGAGKTQKSGSPPPPSKIKAPNKKTDITNQTGIKEDDNFWESFLKMDIIPRPPPPDRPKTKSPPPNKINPPQRPPDAPDKKKKIEEPRFKIHIPFLGDKKNEAPKKKAPAKAESKIDPPPPNTPQPTEKPKDPPVKAPPQPSPVIYKDEPASKPPPTIGEADSSDPKNLSSSTNVNAEISFPAPPAEKKVTDSPNTQQTPIESPPANKTAADHYISDNIVEISKTSKDKDAKTKPNKLETVKLNITTDKRMPSKITEINLKRKVEEPTAGLKKQVPSEPRKTSEAKKENIVENKKFYKNFEKYKTPYGDPEYEEKQVKINLDMESNPNLKKLDNWNKTLVLHDVAKPPENIESWLKDETDKMATLLLKVLQEAATGKPKKKPTKSKSCEKLPNKGNPYDTIRKKQETTSENFLLKVRSVNFLPSPKKGKAQEESKSKKTEFCVEDIPVQSGKVGKSSKVIDTAKFGLKEEQPSIVKLSHIQTISSGVKHKDSELAIKAMNPVVPREFWPSTSFLGDPTEDIPGPEVFKKISNTWKLFPVISCQLTIFTLLKIFQYARRNALNKIFNKYGPIVNIQGLLSGNVILVYKPEHLKEVFEQDTTVPVRSVFDSLEQCRREVEDKLQATGIPMDWSNPEWRDLRKVLSDPITMCPEKYFGTMETASDTLVQNIRKNRIEYNQDSFDFMDEIKKWSTEGLCSVLFERSPKFMEGRTTELNWIVEPERLYSGIHDATEFLSKCERGFQTWRLFPTPASVGLIDSYKNLSNILHKQLYQAEMNLRSKNDLMKEGVPLKPNDLTFVESMVLNDEMTMDEMACNLIDILLMGVNTTSSAMGFLLYDLALHEKVKNKVFNEVKEAMPKKNSKLDYQKLNSLKYLQACIKESLRMHLPLPIFYRVLQRNILLSNYIIPKGTYVVMDGKICSMKEQIFDEPERYMPERWLTEDPFVHNNHPFSAIPFCHGPRSDIARKIAELQLWSCASKVIRNFQVEYHYGEIEENDNFISFPNKPLKLNFYEREE